MGWSFQPLGNSAAIAVTTAASTAVQVTNNAGGNDYLISNASTQGCFLAFDGRASTLQAVAPVAGTPANGIWLQGGSTQTLSLSANGWFSTIAPTGTSTVYITPGSGQ